MILLSGGAGIENPSRKAVLMIRTRMNLVQKATSWARSLKALGNLEPHATKWVPIDGIEAPCWDFSFACRPMQPPSTVHVEIVNVTVHFNGMLPNDLSLQFKNVVAIEQRPDWFFRKSESPAKPLPRCGGKWPRSVFPLLRIEPSAWLGLVAPTWSSAPNGIVHLAIFTSEKALHLAASPDVLAEWVAPLRADA